MQAVAKVQRVRRAVTVDDLRPAAPLVLLPSLDDTSTSMTTAEYMVLGTAYRWRGTPFAFYVRAETTATELRAKLARKARLDTHEQVLMHGLMSVPCPIVAYRITRRLDGEHRELCIISASTQLRKLKALPFA